MSSDFCVAEFSQKAFFQTSLMAWLKPLMQPWFLRQKRQSMLLMRRLLNEQKQRVFGAVSNPRHGGFPSQQEKARVARWIMHRRLNWFGDPLFTEYKGGNPLFESRQSLYQYLKTRHPGAPWRQVG